MSGQTSDTPDQQRRSTQQEPEQNFLFVLIKALLTFFAQALMPDRNAPDFEDASSPQQREQARREYETRRRQEETLPAYTVVPGSGVSSPPRPESDQIRSTEYAGRLMKMRQQAEAANGGTKVQAIIPVAGDGRITSDFGHRHAPAEGASHNHKGLDITSPQAGGKPDIISAMPGIVIGAGRRNDGYGNTVDVMDIYGHTHRYAHLDSIAVSPGQEVRQGQKLAVMGTTGHSTGVHLHYEQRDQAGKPYEPVMMARTWGEGQRFSGKQNQTFLAAQLRPGDDAVAVAGVRPVPASAAAGVARAGIRPESLADAYDHAHNHSHAAPAGSKAVRTRS